MAGEANSTIETRRGQMFPKLTDAEIEQLQHFGEVRKYSEGEYLAKTGVVSPGMFVILSGEVAVTQRDALGHEQPIVTYTRGSFLAEIAVLSGSPALVDGVARTAVEALVIPTPRLRDVM